MNLQIENIVQDTSLLAQALQAQQGLTSFYIPDVASFSLLAHSHTLTVVSLYVTPSMRRQGIATQLLKRIESGAREVGFTLLILSVFMNRPESPSAVAFAESQGLRIHEAGSALDLKSYFKPLKPVLQSVSNLPESSQEFSGA